MELMLQEGDYVPDGNGGLVRAEGSGELLQRVLWKLTVRRGSFPFLPELGSRLYLLPRERGSERLAVARQYIAEALAEEEGLSVTDVRFTPGADGALDVTVALEYQGESLSGTVTVQG